MPEEPPTERFISVAAVTRFVVILARTLAEHDQSQPQEAFVELLKDRIDEHLSDPAYPFHREEIRIILRELVLSFQIQKDHFGDS